MRGARGYAVAVNSSTFGVTGSTRRMPIMCMRSPWSLCYTMTLVCSMDSALSNEQDDMRSQAVAIKLQSKSTIDAHGPVER